jgi:quinoprotein glucose dehydrogenase
MIKTTCIACLALCGLISCRRQTNDNDWPVYGGSKENRHYSALSQIDTANVSSLHVAWTYHTGDADSNTTQIQVNGLEKGGVFYGVSPRLKLFALRAGTGELMWSFDPATDPAYKDPGQFSLNVCRGVALYVDDGQKQQRSTQDGAGSKAGDIRIFYAAGARLFCVDAQSGHPIKSFGQGGSIDLHNGLDRPASDQYIATTSPGIIYKDLIIIGDRVAEETPAAPGDIRAFDVYTGERRWIFHTVPWPGEDGYNSWEDTGAYRYAGGANAWSGFSLDEERGIVFAPTGSASYDFYGGKRRGSDLYANCVLALDAATGKRLWHFQSIHHDLWDRDLPAPPVLVNISKDGKQIDALAQTTKSGFIFLLDRQTGQPIYPVTETKVPDSSELDGEKPWPTQPVPTFLPPFSRQTLTAADLNHLGPDSSYEDLKRRLASYHNGRFQPPSREGTIIFPGYDGGGEWGGPSYDPTTGLLYVNANEMPWVLTMVDVQAHKGQPARPGVSRGHGPGTATKEPPREASAHGAAQTNLEAGKMLYAASCMSCHGPQRQGGGNFPSLLQAPKKYTLQAFEQLLTHGRRMMPAFGNLSETEQKALASFILDDKKLQNQPYIPPAKAVSAFDRMVYTSTGYNKFLTKEGYPGLMPPWGTLTAVDLNQGRIVWKDTLGDYPEFKARGIHTGTENYGGPVVTAGGLLFIAATRDHKIRAFNKRTGELIWEADLPACGFATPTVYEADGKEYLVIACGGGKLKMPSGDSYVAFALP